MTSSSLSDYEKKIACNYSKNIIEKLKGNHNGHTVSNYSYGLDLTIRQTYSVYPATEAPPLKLFEEWEWPYFFTLLTCGGAVIPRFTMKPSAPTAKGPVDLSQLYAGQDDFLLKLLKEALETSKPTKFVASILLVVDKHEMIESAVDTLLLAGKEEEEKGGGGGGEGVGETRKYFLRVEHSDEVDKYKLVNKHTGQVFLVYDYRHWLEIYRVEGVTEPVEKKDIASSSNAQGKTVIHHLKMGLKKFFY